MTIVEKAVAYLRSIASEVSTKDAYYRGEHHPLFSASSVSVGQYRELYARLMDNQCRNVIDLTVDKLRVSGFAAVEEGNEAADAFAKRAWNLWQRDRMDHRTRAWFTECEKAGKPGGLVTWTDTKGRSRIFMQAPTQFACERSEENPDELLWAVKPWWDGERACLTVYTPQTVEIYRSNTKLRMPDANTYFLDPDSTIPNPFGETPADAAGLTYSDLDTVMPLQDALNQALVNAAITDSYYSQHLRVWLGVELEPDPENPGQFIEPFQLGQRRSVFLPPAPPGEQPTDVKDLPGQSSAPLMQAANEYRYAIARAARIPMYLIMQDGNIPSGESLRVASSSFTAKVEARQALYGVPIADAVRRQTAMDMGIYDLNGVPELTTLWVPAAPESQEVSAKIGQAMADIGVPLEIILQKAYGWDLETAQKVQERHDMEQAEAQSAQARIFDAGGSSAGF